MSKRTILAIAAALLIVCASTVALGAVNGHLRIPFFGHEKSPRKGRRVYEQELCISSYLLYASLSWCMLRYGYSSFHSHRLRWLMPSPVVQGDGVFGNYHL